MKIWIANHYAAKPQQAGITRHYTLARALVELGHDVWILACAFEHHSHRPMEGGGRGLKQIERIDGVNFVWLTAPAYSDNGLSRLLNIAGYSAQLATAPLRGIPWPDVLLASSPHLLTPLVSFGLAKMMKIPFVLEIRDLWPESFVELGVLPPRHPAVRLMRMMEGFLYRHSDRVVTLLPGSEPYIAGRGAARSRISWIPNGIDLQLAGEAETPTARDYLLVTYCGAHGLANSLDTIVDAALLLSDESPQVRFRFIGDGPERPRLMARVEKEGIDNAEFLGPVPKAHVYSLLRESDVLIATLRAANLYRHGFSLNKIFDYMSAARPIVFGGRMEYDPIAASGCGLTVPAEDAEATAQAVRRLGALTQKERFELGLRGREYVVQRHDMRTLARALESTLARALENATSGRSRLPTER